MVSRLPALSVSGFVASRSRVVENPLFPVPRPRPLFTLFAVFEPTVCPPLDAVPLGSCFVRVSRFGDLEATGAGFVGVRSRRCGVSELYTFSLFPTLPMSICVY